MHKNLGVCFLRMGEAEIAAGHLRSATEIMERPDRETVELMQVAENDPMKGIDRAVDRSEISAADRPMWEAFEDLGAAPTR